MNAPVKQITKLPEHMYVHLSSLKHAQKLTPNWGICQALQL